MIDGNWGDEVKPKTAKVTLVRAEVVELAVKLGQNLANAQNRYFVAIDDGTNDCAARWKAARLVAAVLLLKASSQILKPLFDASPGLREWLDEICNDVEPSVEKGEAAILAPRAVA